MFDVSYKYIVQVPAGAARKLWAIMQTSTNSQGHWDEIYSTYWWRGEYLPGQKRQVFKGYSKKWGHNEAKDKEYLLIKKVLMLQQHGYIDSSAQIEIHRREGACCMKTDPVILTLYPATYMLGPELITNRTICQSLKDIYDQRNGAREPKYFTPKPKEVNVSTDVQVTTAANKHYKNLDEAISEIHRLQGIGVAEGQLQDTYLKILKKNKHLK